MKHHQKEESDFKETSKRFWKWKINMAADVNLTEIFHSILGKTKELLNWKTFYWYKAGILHFNEY